MKKSIILLVCIVSIGLMGNAQATKKRVAAKNTATKQTKAAKDKQVADSIANAKRISDSLAIAKKNADSLENASAIAKKLAEAGEIKVTLVKPSMKNDNSIAANLIKDKTPLAYDYIREDDAIFREKIWRIIDIREKINTPFGYSADEDNGNQRFINILLNAINPKYPRSPGESAVMAFSDDRFSEPKPFDEIAQLLTGKPTLTQVPDFAKDPDGSKGIMKDSVIANDFNPDKIFKFKIKEEVVFDKEASRLYTRILGIAPILSKTDRDPVTNVEVEREGGGVELFWVYYPDMRRILVKYEAYNAKNLSARRSWEQVFEDRYFSSYIVKTTMNNPKNKELSGYINDPLFRLLEGEKIKEKIFNYEQDLWAY